MPNVNDEHNNKLFQNNETNSNVKSLKNIIISDKILKKMIAFKSF